MMMMMSQQRTLTCSIGRGCTMSLNDTPGREDVSIMVPHLWKGKIGACNTCSCFNGSMSCTKMFCGKGSIKTKPTPMPDQVCAPYGDCCYTPGREDQFCACDTTMECAAVRCLAPPPEGLCDAINGRPTQPQP